MLIKMDNYPCLPVPFRGMVKRALYAVTVTLALVVAAQPALAAPAAGATRATSAAASPTSAASAAAGRILADYDDALWDGLNAAMTGSFAMC